jgi:DNA-binding SARP family transcriptional activator
VANPCLNEPLVSGRDTASLLGHGAAALHGRGDLRAARRWFELACRAAERSGDDAALAEAAIGLGGIWVHEHRRAGQRARVLSWQRRALPLTDADSSLGLQLRARLTAEADYGDGGHSRVTQVLRQAREHGDPETLAAALNLTHHCLLGPQHAGPRAAVAEELLITAARTGSRTDLLMGLLWRTVDRFLDANPHAERSLAELCGELADRSHLAVGYVVRAIEVMLTTRGGDLGRAELLAARCRDLGERCGDLDAEGWFNGQMLAIRWFQGRVGELAPALGAQLRCSDLSAMDNSPLAGLAVAAAAAGDRRTAAGALARLGRGDLTRVPSSSTWLVTMYGVVEAAALLGDAEVAAAAYQLIEPVGRLPMMGSLAVACFGSAQHALGVAALTVGRVDHAVEHLRRAVRHNLALGHWPAACLSRSRLGQALGRRAGPGDAAAADQELAQAAGEADQLGMLLPEPASAGGVDRSRWRFPANGPTVPANGPTVPANGPAGSDTGSAGAAEVRGRPASGVRVRLLGSVDLAGARGPVPLSGLRRKAVLAVLALQTGQVVSTGRLIDIVWGDHPPRTATNTLQSHVSYLRRLIGHKDSIRARFPGYLLDLGDGGTDVAEAEHLIGQATRATDPSDRITGLQDALDLWRGSALLDVGESPWLDAQAERLGQLRLNACRALVEAQLALGRHDQALAQLDPLTRDHPLDEQLHGQLIVALYRAGRPNDSLAVYQRLRSGLGELGIEPSPALHDLQTAILRHDSAPL